MIRNVITGPLCPEVQSAHQQGDRNETTLLRDTQFGGHPIWAALEREIVHLERENVVGAEVVVLVHVGVVIMLLWAGVQRDFTSGHMPCRNQACP